MKLRQAADDLFATSWGSPTTIPGWEPVQRALNTQPKVATQVYRPAGRPQYAAG